MTEKFKETLEVVANFIGTHGLAVFLVVFYTLVIYPQSQKERSDWIEEITKVRMLVDPETKPLNTLQADAISRIVVNQYVNDLQDMYHNQQRNKFSGNNLNPYFFPQENDNKRYLSVFGETFTFDINDSKKSAYKKFDRVFKYIEKKMPESKKELQKEVQQAFIYSKQNNEFVTIQLERLKLQNESLDFIWSKAIEKAEPIWISYFKGKISNRYYYPLDSFFKNITKIPHYDAWSNENIKRIESIQTIEEVDIYSISNNIKNVLEKEMSKSIKVSSRNLNKYEEANNLP